MSIDLLIEAAGTATALSKKARISVQRITNWRTRGIPGDQVLPLSRAVDFEVTPHQISPEMYPNPTDGLPIDIAARLLTQLDDESVGASEVA